MNVVRFTLSAALASVFFSVPTLAQGSDACATAQVISGPGPFAFDNSVATTDGLPNALCLAFSTDQITNDVWFSWTAPASGVFTFSTCGQTSIDTRLAIYDGSCAGTVLACADDSCSTQTSVDVAATAGNVYLLRLGNYPNAVGGTGSFTIQQAGQPLDTRVNPANGRTYHLLAGGARTTAQAAATALGGTLVTLDDQAEHDWVLAQWHNWQGVDVDLWIGLTDEVTEGVFLWDDGTPVGFTLWDLNEPNDGAGGEDYVAMRKNNPLAFWNDLANAPVGYHANPMAVVEIGGPSATPYCFGDGSATACPCGNSSAVGDEVGCLSSLSLGGKLRAAGSVSIANDTFVLQGSQMPNNSSLYFQGTTQLAGGNGVVFGDGLRCVGGTVVRLGTKSNVAGSSQYPGPGNVAISIKGNNFAGATRAYQVWYRNPATFCSASPFNLTNALLATWSP